MDYHKNKASHDGHKKDGLLINGERVLSFFKIIIAESFLKALCFPTKFARSVSHLKDQETYLEDSSGQQWRATVSNHNDALAIVQGWPKFSSEHGLKVGDFLVFHYVPSDQHFIVQIFGQSACEKIKFRSHIGKGKQKARTNTEASPLLQITSGASESQMVMYNPSTDAGIFSEPHSEALLQELDAGPKEDKSAEASRFNSGKEYVNSLPAGTGHTPSPNADKYSCLVMVDGREFLELPESWQKYFPGMQNRIRWIIFLRGPDKRIWPVFYHARSGYDDVLTSGWKHVTAIYGVNDGDSFLFELVDRKKRIFDVRKI